MNYLALKEQPYLVQRLRREDRPHDTGVDSSFRFDYMGAAEFEWGTLAEALRLMRHHDTLPRWEVLRLKVPDGSTQMIAWYVGPAAARTSALAFFRDQLGPHTFYLKECTFLHECYHRGARKDWFDFDGWWALDTLPCPWAIFRNKEHAQLWLKLVRAKKEAR